MKTEKIVEGINSLFSCVWGIQHLGTDPDSPLYCRVLEAEGNSYLYYPWMVLCVNNSTAKEIVKKLAKLGFIADIMMEDSGIPDTEFMTVRDIKSIFSEG
jgi:predicted transcriptional regulator